MVGEVHIVANETLEEFSFPAESLAWNRVYHDFANQAGVGRRLHFWAPLLSVFIFRKKVPFHSMSIFQPEYTSYLSLSFSFAETHTRTHARTHADAHTSTHNFT